MTDEERRIITEFVQRIAGASRDSAWTSRQDAPAPALPPVDREADALIADLFNRYPEARYRITQTTFVQEAALVEALNRIRELEWEAEAARREAQQPSQGGGGFLGGLFGSGGRSAPPPMPPRPEPVYPPGYQPQALQGRGPGFLGTAVAAAAGVAGGLVLGNAIQGLVGGGEAQAAAASVADAANISGPGGWGDARQDGSDAGWSDGEEEEI